MPAPGLPDGQLDARNEKASFPAGATITSAAHAAEIRASEAEALAALASS